MAPFQHYFAAPIVIGFVLVGQSLVAYLGVIAIVLKRMHNGLPIDQNVKKKKMIAMRSSALLQEISRNKLK